MTRARWYIGFVGVAILGCNVRAQAQQAAPTTLAAQQAQSGLPVNETKAAFTSVTSTRDLPNGMEVVSGTAKMSVTALRDDILRIRAGATRALPVDASWAVSTETREKHIAVDP